MIKLITHVEDWKNDSYEERYVQHSHIFTLIQESCCMGSIQVTLQ